MPKLLSMLPSRPTCVAITALGLLYPLYILRAEASCPPINQASPVNLLDTGEPLEDKEAVAVNADQVHSSLEGESVFSGNVQLQRSGMSIFADQITFNKNNNHVDAQGDITLRNDAGDIIKAPSMQYRLNEGAGYTNTSEFSLADGKGRGYAKRINLEGKEQLQLENLHYTTCPPGRDDWFLKASRLKLDKASGLGTARNVVLEFMHVPIFYSPYFSFPLTDKRQSGFLIPRLGYGDKQGFTLATPYYINLAPQYDDTLTPRYMNRRGLQLQNEFRYLGESYNGYADLEYLPNDQLLDDYRAAARLLHNHQFAPRWTGFTNLQWVSDKDYLIDLGENTTASSSTHLPRILETGYAGDVWRFNGRVFTYQTVDRSIVPADRPYARLPQLTLSADKSTGPNHLRYQLDSELTYFERKASVTGLRLDVNPAISLPLRNSYGFLTPKVSMRYTAYNLSEENLISSTDASPERKLSIFSVDTGLFFERQLNGSKTAYTQTLEPRLYYLYIPYKEQDSLPIFDTGIPDFSFYNLFRENRYIGTDRVGDADQVTLALSSRLLKDDLGMEVVRFSFGEIFYFRDQAVNLPGSGALKGTSDMVMEVQAHLGDGWYTRAGLQWDRKQSDTEKGNLQFFYRPQENTVTSLGYRYVKNQQEQADFSFQWPVAQNWTMLGRWNYSLLDEKTLQSYVGIGYRSCCWALRTLLRQHITADGVSNRSIVLELELSGLGKMGIAPESPMEEAKFIFD